MPLPSRASLCSLGYRKVMLPLPPTLPSCGLLYKCVNTCLPHQLELNELRAKVDLLALQREEDLGAVNDLSEDVRQDIDNLYLAIGELSSRIEEKKQAPRRKIGFQQNMED